MAYAMGDQQAPSEVKPAAPPGEHQWQAHQRAFMQMALEEVSMHVCHAICRGHRSHRVL